MKNEIILRDDERRALRSADALKSWTEQYQDEEPRAKSLRGPVIAGLATIILGMGSITAWAFTAHLDSAAVASATVIVDSKRKTISHLEGGILKAFLAHEGELVRAGQPILRLEDTRAKAELEAFRARKVGLEAKLTRLRAEQGNSDTLQFPAELANTDDAITRNVLADERRVFVSRRQMLDRKVEIHEKTIAQQVAELEAVQAQAAANKRQMELNGRELEAVETLFKKGYAPRPRLTELESKQSQLVGMAGELASRKAKAEQAKAQAELEILSLGNDFQQQVAAEIQTSQLEHADTVERMNAANDVLRRVDVVSPEDGIVTNIRYHTPGSVIVGGQPILDIVPKDQPLVVEARVGLADVDSVKVGAPVQVRLTAYSHRATRPLDGRLTYLSADQQLDERQNVSFYVARAEILPESIAANPGATLYPGMPAEVLILNKPRRAIDYFLSPITESFNRAFREE